MTTWCFSSSNWPDALWEQWTELQERERNQVRKKIFPNSHLPCCVYLAGELICHFQKSSTHTHTTHTHTVWWKSQTRGWLELFNSFVRMCPLQWKPISQFKRSDWLQCVSGLSVFKEDTPEWTCTASKLTHCPFHSSLSPSFPPVLLCFVKVVLLYAQLL